MSDTNKFLQELAKSTTEDLYALLHIDYDVLQQLLPVVIACLLHRIPLLDPTLHKPNVSNKPRKHYSHQEVLRSTSPADLTQSTSSHHVSTTDTEAGSDPVTNQEHHIDRNTHDSYPNHHTTAISIPRTILTYLKSSLQPPGLQQYILTLLSGPGGQFYPGPCGSIPS